MQDRSATLKDEIISKAVQQPATEVNGIKGPKTMRFTYPSGSQPLEGFTIKRGIGIGGFGEVYFAISEAGKEVAIKRIQRNLDVELRGVKQCLNLKHINLIGLWDIKSNDLGESWVVMEYVPGYSLREKLEHHPQGMVETELKQWFLSIAAGVNYLHKHGIVHRDLKPGNIFYDTDQQVVKIGDYGLSKFISSSKRSGQTESVGTFHYMAPEIGKGIYGKEIDIYALGVILYEMLCGEMPFDGESAQEIIMKHLTADPDLSRIGEGYRRCVAGCLEKDPTQRFSTVQEMLAELPWPDVDLIKNSIAFSSSFPSAEVVSESEWGNSEKPFTIEAAQNEEVVYIGENGIEVISAGRSLNSVQSRFTNGLFAAGHTSNERIAVENRNGTIPLAKLNGPREPIARAIQGGMSGILGWWKQSEVSVPLKVTIAIVASIILIINSSWLLLSALIFGFLYLAYYAVFCWFAPADHEVKLAETKYSPRSPDVSDVRMWLANRTFSERMTDLTGSMLIAATSCLVLSFIGLAIRGTILQPDIQAWSIYAWMAITTTIASWIVLIASKTWEHRHGDPWLRRLTMATSGIFLGGCSYLLGQFFFVDGFREPLEAVQTSLPQVQGINILTGFLLFFTAWFGISSMSSAVDPTRSTRLTLWRVGMGFALGVLLGHFTGMNEALFGMVVVVTSIASQLAAPLVNQDAFVNSKISQAV